jgi:hypothetical protein
VSAADRYAPLEFEPVSVHPPYTSYPGGQFRYESTEERRAAVQEALTGVSLGAFDQRFVRWLCAGDVAMVASLVSLLWRARAAGAAHERPAAQGGDGGLS